MIEFIAAHQVPAGIIVGCAFVLALAVLVLRYMRYRLIMAEPDEHADVAGGEG